MNAVPLQLHWLWIIQHHQLGRILLQHHPSLKCIREMEARNQHKNLFLLNDLMDCRFPSDVSLFYFQRDASLLWLKQMLQATKILQGYKEPFLSWQRPRSWDLQAQESWLAQNYFRLRGKGICFAFSSLLYWSLNIHIFKFTLLLSYLFSNPPYFYLVFEVLLFFRPSRGTDNSACPLNRCPGVWSCEFCP